MALVLASRALADLEASRPGAHRTADLPLLSPSVACAVAFLAYPAVVLGLRAALDGRAYDTDAPWLRYLGAVHNAILGVFSLGMWVGVFYTLGTDSTYSSAIEFFCLPEGTPVMPPRLSLFPYLFYLSKIYEVRRPASLPALPASVPPSSRELTPCVASVRLLFYLFLAAAGHCDPCREAQGSLIPARLASQHGHSVYVVLGDFKSAMGIGRGGPEHFRPHVYVLLLRRQVGDARSYSREALC